jgi:hypothetical protein
MLDPQKDQFQPLPTGKYYGEITGIKYFLSSRKKTPGIAFKITILTGDQKGKTHTENYYLTQSALPRLATFCVAAGRKTAFEETDPEETWKALGGKRFKFELEHKEFKGNVSAQFSKIEKLNKKEKMKLNSIDRQAPTEIDYDEAGFTDPGDSDGFDNEGNVEDFEDDDIPF